MVIQPLGAEDNPDDSNISTNDKDNPDNSNIVNNAGNNSSVLKTGDIAIKLFATLMIVSLVGIVAILIIKKRNK